MAQFSGQIKSYNATKGWGFIQCAETEQMYGKDIFVLKNKLAGGDVSSGDQVTFTVEEGDKGIQASNIRVVRRANGSGHAGAAGRPMIASLGRPGGGYAMPMPGAGGYGAGGYGGGGGKGAPTNGGMVGTVKSYNAEKGWGFVTSETLIRLYGKDVFFTKRALPPSGFLEPGQQVSFEVVQMDKGPQAQSLRPVGGHAPPRFPTQQFAPPQVMGAYGAIGAFPGAGGRGRKGGAPAALPMMPPGLPGRFPPHMAMPAAPAPNPNQLFFGAVKTFSEEKGWGHIICKAATQAYGKDVFLMRSACGDHVADAQPGALAAFKIAMGNKGPQASDVTFLPPGSFGTPDGEPGIWWQGAIKSYNELKGWGFLTSEEIQSTFGKDIFMHKRDMQAGTPVPSQGEEFQFTVEVGDSGRLEAKNVSPAGDAPPEYEPARAGNRVSGRAAPY